MEPRIVYQGPVHVHFEHWTIESIEDPFMGDIRSFIRLTGAP